VQTGSGRAPLIIAIVAAIITYAAFGSQSPFSFLHHLAHHKITVNTDKTADAAEDARQAAEDSAQAEADRAQEQVDRAQEMRDRAQEVKERAEELGQRATELAQTEAAKAVAAPPPAVPPASPAALPAGVEIRALDPFDRVTIENNADVTVTIGDAQSVTITGGGHTDTHVRDGKLTVSGSFPGVRVAIIMPHLHALQVNGYGKVSLVGLRDPITIKANGAVELWGSGAVESAELVMNGPSKFQLAKLEAKNLTVQVNGVGDADVYATDTLVADVKGVGHVRYRGDPHLVTTINGPGTVQRVASDAG
jgi:hypothetical protein